MPIAVTQAKAAAAVAAVEKHLKAGAPLAGAQGNTRGKGALRLAADDLGVTVGSLRGTLAAAKRHHGIEPDASLVREAEGRAAEDAVSPSERQRFKDTIARLTRELGNAHRAVNEGDDLKEALFGLKTSPLVLPDWMTAPAKSGRSGPGVPILFTSDFQWGEVVRLDEMDGLNAYNPEIARTRYRHVVDTTIDLAYGHMVRPKYPGIVYLRGGDTVSGEIHDELRETQTLTGLEQAKDAAAHEIAGIERLVNAFGAAVVISVPGNHGRTTRKSHAKRYAALSYDHLATWMIEAHFQARPEAVKRRRPVTFFHPESGDARFAVFASRFVLVHGDRIGSRGGQGFIGPAATVQRGIYKVRKQYAEMGRPVDHVMVGHFHTAMRLQHGYVNGSLVGFNEYAKAELRVEPEPPQQLLLFVHPRWGITAEWQVKVERRKPDPAMGGWCSVETLPKAGTVA